MAHWKVKARSICHISERPEVHAIRFLYTVRQSDKSLGAIKEYSNKNFHDLTGGLMCVYHIFAKHSLQKYDVL
jgi:hypothetical protein